MGAVPETRAEVTPAWIDQVLRGVGALDTARVVGHELASVAEQGQTGDVLRLHLRYDHPEVGAPASLVVKLAAPFEQARQYMHSLGLYEAEVRFYQEFGDDPGIPIPRVYFSDIDTASGAFVIVMEDMQGCRNGDFWTCRVEDVETALRHAAPFHARWWQSERILGTDWLRKPDDAAYYGETLGPVLRAFLPQVEEKFPESWTGYLRDTARQLADGWDGYWPARDGQAFTLVHTDFHPKQCFFPTADGGRFAVFDWQTVTVGVAGGDVQRVLLTGLTPAQLREHQDRLIGLYHGLLTEHGVDYPLAQLLFDVRHQMLTSLFIAVFALATTDVSIIEAQASERGLDYRDRIFRDMGQALEFNRVHELIA